MTDASGKVKQLREARGWSQEHLAAVAGLSARTVQRVEADGRASGDTRMAIAAVLGVTPAELAEAPPAAPPAAARPAVDPSAVWFKLAIVVMMMLAGGYIVGKDLALRDNARAASSR